MENTTTKEPQTLADHLALSHYTEELPGVWVRIQADYLTILEIRRQQNTARISVHQQASWAKRDESPKLVVERYSSEGFRVPLGAREVLAKEVLATDFYLGVLVHFAEQWVVARCEERAGALSELPPTASLLRDLGLIAAGSLSAGVLLRLWALLS